jgi:hypothetical protein
MAVALSLLVAPGCPGPEEVPSEEGLRLALTCAFDSTSGTQVEAGKAFLYLLHDAQRDAYYAVHGIAREQEALSATGMRQRGELPLHPTRTTTSGYEWKEQSGGVEHTNWVGSGWKSGQPFSHFAVSHLSDDAYPLCFAHPE